MLKLPFINRERYILIKAYTFDRAVHRDKTLAMTGTSVGVLNRCPVSSKTNWEVDFSTCYGMNAAMKRSLTLSSWSEILVEYSEDPHIADHIHPPDNGLLKVMPIKDDPVYPKQKNARLYKIITPWMLTCNKDINFVMANHLMNTLPMNIPTGIIHFETTHAPHLFTTLHLGQKYKIPYKAPLAQIFPMSDLPLHLETYWDNDMFRGLFDARLNRPFFRANGIKLVNRNKT